jgi:hypothetical protein
MYALLLSSPGPQACRPRPGRASRRRPGLQLCCECLEERTLPSVHTAVANHPALAGTGHGKDFFASHRQAHIDQPGRRTAAGQVGQVELLLDPATAATGPSPGGVQATAAPNPEPLQARLAALGLTDDLATLVGDALQQHPNVLRVVVLEGAPLPPVVETHLSQLGQGGGGSALIAPVAAAPDRPVLGGLEGGSAALSSPLPPGRAIAQATATPDAPLVVVVAFLADIPLDREIDGGLPGTADAVGPVRDAMAGAGRADQATNIPQAPGQVGGLGPTADDALRYLQQDRRTEDPDLANPTSSLPPAEVPAGRGDMPRGQGADWPAEAFLDPAPAEAEPEEVGGWEWDAALLAFVASARLASRPGPRRRRDR